MTTLADTPTASPVARRARSRYLAGLRSASGITGLVLILLLVVAGLLAPLLTPIGPIQQGPAALAPAGGEHLLGTDELGRDLYARMLYGIRTDLLITLIAVPIAAVAGTALGLIGAVSRAVGSALQRVFDVLLGIPAVILGVGLVIALGAGMTAIIVAVVLATIPVFGRQARGALLTQLSREYVTAATVIGTPRRTIIRRHILPNVVDSVLALVAVAMATAVKIEGGLSVIGLGVVPPDPSLGSMIKSGAPYLFTNPLYAMVPVVLVIALVLGYTLVANALNAAVLRR